MIARSPIGKVLIVDSDPIHAAALEHALQMVICRVLVRSEQEAVLNALRIEHLDLVVVVPASPAQWRKDAEPLCDALRRIEEQPLIVFILRCPYMGPDERLYGDRLNIKVMYER